MSEVDLIQLRVLYIEDDEDTREQLSHFLCKKCEGVLQAGSAWVALKIFEEQRPDLIVSDVMMPEMNGLEFAEAI